MKVRVEVELETSNIFDNTTVREDMLIAEEFLNKCSDEALLDELEKRGINDQFFANLSKAEQEALIEQYAEDYGYFKSE